MKNKVLIFEGTDASGKTTLIEEFAKHLAENKITHKIITRKDNENTHGISKIIQAPEIEPISEVLLRCGREYIRYQELLDNNIRYFLLDRALLSIVSMIRIYQLDCKLFSNILYDLKSRLKSYGTVLCNPPFEAARKRMTERQIKSGLHLSKKEARGKDFNLEIYSILSQEFRKGDFTGHRLELDTHKLSIKDCVEKIIAFSDSL